MRILLWHVHGSYTTAMVQGNHTYLLPVVPGRGPDGHGRAETWDWPTSAVEVTAEECAAAPVDLVILQRPEELDHLAQVWLGGRRPGRDVPAVYLEHNMPQGRINDLRHPAADRSDLTVVHVTTFNDLFWDCGSTPTRVIEHGIVDPGHRYTGELARQAVVVNEPVRRARVSGTDLLPRLSTAGPMDVFGMKVTGLETSLRPGCAAFEDVPQDAMHDALARRRVYVHPFRWTSLGLALIEAMQLGMPVVAVGAGAAWEAIPEDVGVVSTDVEKLTEAIRSFLHDFDAARVAGEHARRVARERFGLGRFLADWEQVYREVTA